MRASIMACRKKDKKDLHILQNDILGISSRSCISDRISIDELHAKFKIVSLEQCRRKQLLSLTRDVILGRGCTQH